MTKRWICHWKIAFCLQSTTHLYCTIKHINKLVTVIGRDQTRALRSIETDWIYSLANDFDSICRMCPFTVVFLFIYLFFVFVWNELVAIARADTCGLSIFNQSRAPFFPLKKKDQNNYYCGFFFIPRCQSIRSNLIWCICVYTILVYVNPVALFEWSVIIGFCYKNWKEWFFNVEWHTKYQYMCLCIVHVRTSHTHTHITNVRHWLTS